MRYGKSGSKLGRTTSHKKAMLRNMATSMIKYEKIRTTDSKAKEFKKVADKLVTLGKRGSLHARRQASSFVRDRAMVTKLFDEIASRYQGRSGGYTRVIKVSNRPGDNAPISIIEFVK